MLIYLRSSTMMCSPRFSVPVISMPPLLFRDQGLAAAQHRVQETLEFTNSNLQVRGFRRDIDERSTASGILFIDKADQPQHSSRIDEVPLFWGDSHWKTTENTTAVTTSSARVRGTKGLVKESPYDVPGVV